jgi:mRNA deadenylase 3'-5' endonuclease subunit Ccr4
VKVATFNVNNINKRLDSLLAWLAKAEPDVVSLQELKAERQAFPVNALRTLGYEAVSQPQWTSTATPQPWPSARPIGPLCNASYKGLPIKRFPVNK